MIINQLHKIARNKTLFCFICSITLLLLSFSANAQEEPPRPLKVTKYQDMSFGAIIQGVFGGTVTMDPQGSRSVTSGDVILANLGYSYSPAIFRVDAIPGSIISIDFGLPTTLTGTSGSLTLQINSSYPASPFINTKSTDTEVRIGGILTIGNSSHNPAGNYIGDFHITFVQQ